MQRLIVLALVFVVGFDAQQQRPPASTDPVARVLLDLEQAIAAGRIGDFRALATKDISAEAVMRVSIAIGADANDRAIVRERQIGRAHV